jgi:hypothetical protein
MPMLNFDEINKVGDKAAAAALKRDLTHGGEDRLPIIRCATEADLAEPIDPDS